MPVPEWKLSNKSLCYKYLSMRPTFPVAHITKTQENKRKWREKWNLRKNVPPKYNKLWEPESMQDLQCCCSKRNLLFFLLFRKHINFRSKSAQKICSNLLEILSVIIVVSPTKPTLYFSNRFHPSTSFYCLFRHQTQIPSINKIAANTCTKPQAKLIRI